MKALQKLISQVKLRVERARARYWLVDVGISTFKRYSNDDGGFYAASLTYFTFFSVFPLMLFVASLVGYLSFLSPGVKSSLVDSGTQAIPLLGSILSKTALNALADHAGTLAITGLVLGLYSGSGGVVALSHALNRIYGVTKEAGFIPKRLASLKWLGLIALTAVVSLGLSGVASYLGLSGSSTHPIFTVLGQIVAHLIGIGVGLVLFLTAFKLLPAKKLTWSEVLPGSVIAAVAFEILKIVGTWYLANGADSRKATFGAFATAAGLLVASYLLAQITLLAGEVNATLADRRQMRHPTPERAIEPDQESASSLPG